MPRAVRDKSGGGRTTRSAATDKDLIFRLADIRSALRTAKTGTHPLGATAKAAPSRRHIDGGSWLGRPGG